MVLEYMLHIWMLGPYGKLSRVVRYRACYFGCFKGISKSVQVLLDGIDAIVLLTLITLK